MSARVAPPSGTHSRGWPLIYARLRPPLDRGTRLSRARLLAILDALPEATLALVHAPAGFGKTTLLAEWFEGMRASGRTIAWVTQEDIDQDASRFLRYLASALGLAHPEAFQGLPDLMSGVVDAPPRAAAAQLLEAIEGAGQDVFVVIDDLRGAADSEVFQLCDSLFNEAGERLHFVVACREIPAVSLARLRMRKALIEVDARDLQFREDEAIAYLRTQPDVNVTDAQVAALCARTDGWIAGLQVAALSLKGRPDASSLIDEFSGKHRDVEDLIADEVLSRLDADTVEFLLRTSILASFDAALCNACTGRTDGQAMLQRLEQAGLFVFAIDESRTYFRYHSLFADVLQKQLDVRHPGLKAELHRQAADWHAVNGFPIRGADHAFRAGDPALAAEILERSAAGMLLDGNGATLLSLAARIPPHVLDDFPHLQLQRAYGITLEWQFEAADALLRGVRRSLADAATVKRWEARGLNTDNVYQELLLRDGQLALLRDEMPAAARLNEEWLAAGGPKASYDTAVARTSLVYAQREMYDCSGIDSAGSVRRLFSDEGRHWATVWHDTILGSTWFHAGNLAAAESLYRQAFETAIRVTGRSGPMAAMAALYLAELLYEIDRTEEAFGLLETYLAMGDETGLVDQLIAGYVTMARLQILRSQGDASQAMKTLERGESIAHAKGFERLRVHLLAERVRLLLAAGETREAWQVVRAGDLAGDPDRLRPERGVTTVREIMAVTWAQMALSRNRASEAIALLEEWAKFTQTRRCLRSHVRLGVWLTRAHVVRGETSRAQRRLRATLSTALAGPFIRSFVDAGEPVRDLLVRARASHPDEDYALARYRARLLEHFGRDAAPVAPVESTQRAAPEALGPRELEILGLVARGLMNSQIADDLGLTVGTVKWYMQQIFAKLGAKRRAEAVHRARQLGLIH